MGRMTVLLERVFRGVALEQHDLAPVVELAVGEEGDIAGLGRE
jgi:hypothetical protein